MELRRINNLAPGTQLAPGRGMTNSRCTTIFAVAGVLLSAIVLTGCGGSAQAMLPIAPSAIGGATALETDASTDAEFGTLDDRSKSPGKEPAKGPKDSDKGKEKPKNSDKPKPNTAAFSRTQ